MSYFNQKKMFFWLVIPIILLFVFSCKDKQPVKESTKRLLIITTLFPLYDFTRQIVDVNVQVEMLLPPSVEPHSFEPKPSDITRLNNADVIIYTGKYMEPWMEKIIRSLDTSKVKVIDASVGVTLIKPKDTHSHNIHHHESDTDPHIWLDFENAQKMIDNISTGIIERSQDKSKPFLDNATRLKDAIGNLDQKYRDVLSRCTKKVIVSGGHQTFNYLCNRYNVRCISAYGLSPNSEPTAKTLSNLTKIIKQQGLKHIFFEDVVNPRVANTLSKETGAEMLQLRSGHNLTAEEFKRGVTFQSLMEDNLKNLQKGLQCQ